MVFHSNFSRNLRKSTKWSLAALPKISIILVAGALVLSRGFSSWAALITGKVQDYDPTSKQATINLGKSDGIDKYDQGKIELSSLDDPNTRFVGANITVLSVDQNTAIVSVREAPGVQIPIKPGARVTLDTGSGTLRRKKEAQLLAQQQTPSNPNQIEQARAAAAQRQRELEQARAAAAQRQRELEQARAAAAQRQRELEQAQARQAQQERELEQARAAAAQRQRELEQARAAAAQRQRELEQAQAQQTRQERYPEEAQVVPQRQRELEQARARQAQQERELEQAQASAAQRQRELEQAKARQAQQERELEKAQADAAQRRRELEQAQTPKDWTTAARTYWRQDSPADIQVGGKVADLPSDYLSAYLNARRQPSPETYYAFAQTLIDYQVPQKALMWLTEAESSFPQTRAVNDVYEAVALAQLGEVERGLSHLELSGMPDDPLITEVKSYLLTQQAAWQDVSSLYEQKHSPVTLNNYLIAQYCTQPPQIDRETNIEPAPCPFGSIISSSEPSTEGLKTIRKLSGRSALRYSSDPYLLNTLGFLALQTENYERAYVYYQQLAQVLDRHSSNPPQLESLKVNAFNYVNNYNQNYEFLTSRSVNLDLLRGRQDMITAFISLQGAENLARGFVNGGNTGRMIGNAIRTIFGAIRSNIQSNQLADERRATLDQMRRIFAQDMNLIAARPKLEARQLLTLTAANPRQRSVERKLLDALR